MSREYGLQLYSVRDLTGEDLELAIEKVAALGYKYVEFAGFFGHSAEEVRAMLDKHNIAISGTHSPLFDLRPSNLANVIDYHKKIGNPRYIIPGCDLSTLEKIEEFASIVNYAQPILAAEGIKLGYHNHSHEFVVMPWGSTIHSEIERRTNIEFEIDTFWTFNAGIDSVKILEKLKDRISVIHLKDGFRAHDGEGAKGMSLGSGEAPVKAVIDAADRMGFKMVVESETLSPTGIEEVTRCINYLNSLEA
ncbi:MAG: sugar phosphate isomerase/epimerase [Ruminococcaceae bacterium]|nr:sugar phosphate isomerase/epimerase [Oscillospiraceae bacterium]